MASIYDSIKTAKELLEKVAMQGFSTQVEDICKAQDIFGHATIEELVALANDNGRNNDKGEPDARGSWSSGRKGFQQTFYSVLFQIWNWEDATRFYNQYSNFPVIDEKAELQEAKKQVKQLKQEISDLDKLERATESMLETEKKKATELEADKKQLEASLESAQEEILKLKAKLYDLMTKEEK